MAIKPGKFVVISGGLKLNKDQWLQQGDVFDVPDINDPEWLQLLDEGIIAEVGYTVDEVQALRDERDRLEQEVKQLKLKEAKRAPEYTKSRNVLRIKRPTPTMKVQQQSQQRNIRRVKRLQKGA